jgi:uncharacterized protein YkwD
VFRPAFRSATLHPARCRSVSFVGVPSVVCFVTVLAAILSFTPATRAGASSSLAGLTNNARTSRGLPPLAVSGDLAAAARQQAARMAARGALYHTPNLGGAVCCWTALGENVGVGPSIDAIFSAFMGSAEHRANILSGSFTQVGVGVVTDARGQLWVTEIFRRPSGAAPAAVPPPTRAAPPAPKPGPPARPTATPARPPQSTNRAPMPSSPPAAPPTRASRDLARLALDDATRFARALVGRSGLTSTYTEPDPVSRMLAFVAGTAGNNTTPVG